MTSNELTPREPHERRYTRDGKTALIAVNDHGVVEITEELLHQLLLDAGFTEENA